MIYKGGCHCGAISFEVEGELDGAVACACSICSKKGGLSWAVPHSALRVKGTGEGIGAYSFGNRKFVHRFCEACGVHPYHEDAEASAERSAYINVRCLEGVDLAKVSTFAFDGGECS